MKLKRFDGALALLVHFSLVLSFLPLTTFAQGQKGLRKPVEPKIEIQPQATSGSTNLFTFTGGGAATSNGDYVSASGGLSTYYSFFIEVPPSTAELNLDIFDADIGLGGAAEAAAGRDRARSGFDSSVTYSLRDPAGTVRPVAFTTGDTTNPALSDNAWLSIFRGNGRSVADNFGTVGFTNNDGTDNFTGNWIETDAGGAGAGSGNVQIAGSELRVSGNGNSLAREVDLASSGLNVSRAFLDFTFDTTGNLDNADQVAVEVSNNGGGAWTTLETFTNDSSGSRQYDISAYIASNTRIRFRTAGTTWTAGEFFDIDNLSINDGSGGAITPGHWELRVDMSGSGGDDINALGVRAHDGTPGAGGVELNMYAAGMLPLGVNNPASGTSSRSYTLFPYITSGCSCSKNDFDYDGNSGTVGSMSYSSRTSTFSQSFASASLSSDNAWSRGNITGWTSDQTSAEYGIWSANLSITSYISGGQNSNYTDWYMGNYAAAANPPAANPAANSFRIYLPNDSGAAPAKPHLSQNYIQMSGPNPIGVGQSGTMRVIVRFVNPTAFPVTFTAANPITANVPGSGAVFASVGSISQGSIVSQPALGGTGNVVWNPGSVAAGATVTMTYDVTVTPTSAGQRIPVTATPASGNGTRARYVDETGNTTQTAATYTFGPICEIAVTQGALNPALSAAPASISGRVFASAGRGLSNAIVTITSFDGTLRTARTNTFGMFAFKDVPTGSSYVIAVESRRYVFQPQVLNLDDSITGLEFAPLP
ncbi:MAG: carboxypeptidase-like regulatory domain-containing protein [Pyrinomonadaceae bacterium]